MSAELCTCNTCRRRNGNGHVIPRSTWYTHNPGGKKVARLAARQSFTGGLHLEGVSRDNLGAGPSTSLGKRSAEEDADPPDRARRVTRSDSVRVC